jgi:DNA modification methylase
LRDYGIEGQIGLEPTIEEFVAKMVAIFREVRRVLRKDGVLWLNLGDSYSNDTKWGGSTGGKHSSSLHGNTGIGRQKTTSGLKPKDLCGVPWRVALALQADGWWLRSDIIWTKPNPMPESCTDRPTTAHEHIFLLTKSAKYFWDAEAVKEKSTGQNGAATNFQRETKDHLIPGQSEKQHRINRELTEDNGSRNLRSVWTIATAPFPQAHFATFPPAIPERCIKAGSSERGCCPKCGAPWRRVVEKKGGTTGKDWNTHDRGKADLAIGATKSKATADGSCQVKTTGWSSTCTCPHTEADLIPATVLDPFTGSGTTALVAAKLGRDAIGVELNPEYVEMSRKRIADALGFLAEITVHDLVSADCPPTKNPAHNEPGLLQKLVEAAGVEPVASEPGNQELAGVKDKGKA